eukprot:TRINITY_DN7167_c0_g1_i4.p1 TRINITY_DN7167_c0_g1~~TRINITY_DN7167_c0_g1_i4.p1  ORF type:complete len:567 (+),score=158.73 TRINITY_DN7167_c0_g1_i4:289-1989(+)
MANLKQEEARKSANTEQKPKAERLDEEDPLDSYMSSLKKSLLKQHQKKTAGSKPQQDDGEEPKEFINSDDEVYETARQLTGKDNPDFLDESGDVNFEALRGKKKNIEALPPVDHTRVYYQQFTKDFYEEHEEIAGLSGEQVAKLRADMEIKVSGRDVPRPIVSFAHLGLDETLVDKIIKQNFERPTPIQCQALPCLLSGRDVIGIAKTGSGKTVAYVWPMIVHILAQAELEKDDGPIGLVLTPTRELTQQVYVEARRYAKPYNISVAALLGGESKHEQWKELRAGVEILIATPGRLIEMIKKKATNMRRVTFLVLDEADRMFSMGFEGQVRSVLGQIRPTRQVALFSATFKKKLQNLATDILDDPITINVGKALQANEDVYQEVVLFDKQEEKHVWMVFNIDKLVAQGKVLIFVNHIADVENLAKTIRETFRLNALALHGDKLQSERTQVINQFRLGEFPVLVATDIASRGLDIPTIRTVVNYDAPKDAETHIHRVGRTGRAGERGVAFTLLLRSETRFAAVLIKNLEISGQPVPMELEDIAMGEDAFKLNRMRKKTGYTKGDQAA